MPHYQGHKWIRNDKRCAIYARDGFRCVYCGAEDDSLELDHVDPRGGNEPANLVTACADCNTSKGSRDLDTWLRRHAGLEAFGSGDGVRARVALATATPIDRVLGKFLEHARGLGGPGSFGRLRNVAEDLRERLAIVSESQGTECRARGTERASAPEASHA